MRSRASVIAASVVSWLVRTIGTGCPGLRARWMSPSIETSWSRRHGGDVGQNARAIDHHEADVIAAAMCRHRGDPLVLEPRRGHAEGWRRGVAGDVDEVGHDRRGRGPGPGTPALEHHRADVGALGDDGVEHAADLAIGASFATMAGWTRCSSPASVRRATPKSLIR